MRPCRSDQSIVAAIDQGCSLHFLIVRTAFDHMLEGEYQAHFMRQYPMNDFWSQKFDRNIYFALQAPTEVLARACETELSQAPLPCSSLVNI